MTSIVSYIEFLMQVDVLYCPRIVKLVAINTCVQAQRRVFQHTGYHLKLKRVCNIPENLHLQYKHSLQTHCTSPNL